ncbi:distal tail protein Dit [Bacillus sonorensis]|uniref:distal tail protein Dit n=1 Tax=Bacillus sonorensis TaxID=119858 RepID=UPI002281F64C|nr:distal tail protein Dit [Bacillus sonorensis]MCY8035645.1 phage tail family protein [Bacillus sonorensis]MCY8563706.1 phage tail family protein [Bacillus sonorensis]
MIDYKKILTTAIDDAFGQTIQEVDYWIKFNGITLTDYFFVIDDRGRGIVGRELNLVSLPGVDGAKLKGVRYTERTIEIDTLFMAANDAELRKILEEINYILATDKEQALIFSDEPDRTYYAAFSTAQEGESKNGVYKVTLTFVCPNPEKEGEETIFTLGDHEAGSNLVKNGDFSQGKDYWYSSGNTGDVVPISSGVFEFKQAFEIKQPDIYLIYYFDNPNWWRDKKGYASCWAKVKNSTFDDTKGKGAALYFRARKVSDQSYIYFQNSVRLTGDTDGWIQLSFPFDFSTITEEIDQLYFAISTAGGYTAVEAQFTGFMVTLTDHLTPWEPYGQQIIVNDGLRPVSPTVTCIFDADDTSYEVQLLKEDGTINERVKLVYNFIKGDTLVIDFDKEKATINGEVNMNAVQMLSEFFDIPVGECTLKTTHKSSIRFRKAYM